MGSVNFYLKAPEKLSGKSLIFLQFKYAGKRLVFSFKQTVDPDNWSGSKQRVKSNKATTEDGQYALNDLLDNLEKECLRSYNRHLKNGIPSTEMIKADLSTFMNQNSATGGGPTLFTLIERFISGEIKNKGKEKTSATKEVYRQTRDHLIDFSAKARYPVDFNTITLDFYYKFVSFLKAEGLSLNSIGKHIKSVKTFMSEAVDLKYTTNFEFRNKKFVVTKEDVDAVYLNEREILKLYRYDLSDRKRLDQVRDLFCFGCWVGLRFSDFSNVKPENIVAIDQLMMTCLSRSGLKRPASWLSSPAALSYWRYSPNTRIARISSQNR